MNSLKQVQTISVVLVLLLALSAVLPLVVQAQTIWWDIYPNKWTRLRGDSATYYVVVASQHSRIGLSIQGLPPGATARFDPPSGNSLFGNFLSKLTISTGTATPIGTYSLTIIVTTEQARSQKTITLKVVPNTDDGASLVAYDAYAKYLSPMFWSEQGVITLLLFSSDFGSSFTNPFSVLKKFISGIVAPSLSRAENLAKQVLTIANYLTYSGMARILGFTSPGVHIVDWEVRPLVEISSLIEQGDRASASNKIRDFLATLHTWLRNIENYRPDNMVVTEPVKQAAQNLVLSVINFLQSESMRLGAPTLVVDSPNGGEVWRGGSSQTIRWRSVGVTGNVRIDISRDCGSTWATIIPNTPNDGSEPWTVTGPTSTCARIRVISNANPAVWDMSDRTFTIDATPPRVTVISPNGGEVWRVGSTQTIRWSASDDIQVTRIDIFYSTDGGRSWRSIARDLTNTGSYSWRVPNTPSTNCLVRIVAYDAAGNAGYDISDRPFTIRR